MEKKLITVASHSYERAQLLKTLLEDCGIPVYLENVNLLDGTYTKGARVRVCEDDFEKTLKIVEEAYQRMGISPPKEKTTATKILIPIDFSQGWKQICRLGFSIAEKAQGEILFVHVYYCPIMTGIPFSDSFTYGLDTDESVMRSAEKANEQMEAFMLKVQRKIKDGEYPKVAISSKVLTGIPEDEIVSLSQTYEPTIIVMGTRGVNKKHEDMIGSVTAEVMDRVKVPVFAIPDDATTQMEEGIKLMYITNFEDRDFHSFDKLIRLLSPFNIEFHIVHFSEENTPWSRARLEGMEHIFKERYGAVENVTSSIIETNDFLLEIESFVRKNKIDVISMTMHRRNIFARMFNPGIARKMLFHTDTPMLVFHN